MKKLTKEEANVIMNTLIKTSCALSALTESLQTDHFEMSLEASIAEAKVKDEREGAFFWMQRHYDSIAAGVAAAACLADSLSEHILDFDELYFSRAGDAE